MPSKKLGKFIGREFSRFQHTTFSQDMFVDIATASKFGSRNAVLLGGVWFVLQNIFIMLNHRLALRDDTPLDEDPETGQYVLPTYSYGSLYNIFALGILEKKLIDNLE